ncbi:MAG: lysophospholipid acyltransferase family protein [Bacteroidetes bacterium]|nr:lysophospholipid acyltransferase family protein [Bacteroidota bacterium]
MPLVYSTDVAAVLGLAKTGLFGRIVGRFVLWFLSLDEINKIYDKSITSGDESQFLEALLFHFRIKYHINPDELKRIPTKGPVVLVSNHPLGGIDGIILMHFMQQLRPDVKLMANFLLERATPLNKWIIPVNPFNEKQSLKSSLVGFRNVLRHLENEGLFAVFPAGEVASHLKKQVPIDPVWNEATIRLIQRANVPVVPIYFHARNSPLFYRLAKIHDLLRTARLPAELLTQRNRTIDVRVGKVISIKDQNIHTSVTDYAAFLRRKVYMLSNSFEPKHLLNRMPRPLRRRSKKVAPIASPVSTSLLENEIAWLQQQNKSLLTSKDYELFLTAANEIPNILNEIGRQREIAFRAVGEGTNKSLDFDHFDQDYLHLFLWDHQAKSLVGAYRLGLGKVLMNKHGISGFYLAELFKFDDEVYFMLNNTIELGRAFVAQQYQQRPMPLFLLWKGIIHATLRYPEYDYLMGSVSISNQFSKFTKSLMIEFMRSHYYDPFLAQYITPKKEFKVKLNDADKEFVFDETSADLNKFDKLIQEVEPGALRLPVLIKKYIKQNARVVSFNVDPLFNNAIDGLMYIKVKDIPASTVQPVLEEFQASLEAKSQSSK